MQNQSKQIAPYLSKHGQKRQHSGKPTAKGIPGHNKNAHQMHTGFQAAKILSHQMSNQNANKAIALNFVVCYAS